MREPATDTPPREPIERSLSIENVCSDYGRHTHGAVPPRRCPAPAERGPGRLPIGETVGDRVVCVVLDDGSPDDQFDVCGLGADAAVPADDVVAAVLPMQADQGLAQVVDDVLTIRLVFFFSRRGAETQRDHYSRPFTCSVMLDPQHSSHSRRGTLTNNFLPAIRRLDTPCMSIFNVRSPLPWAPSLNWYWIRQSAWGDMDLLWRIKSAVVRGHVAFTKRRESNWNGTICWRPTSWSRC
jgi:hypothetical protein